jgi:hypothetical protein
MNSEEETMLQIKSVRDYLEETLQRLDIDLWMYESSEQRGWKQNAKTSYWTKARWLEAGWAKIGPRFGSSLKIETQTELISGTFKWQDHHVKTWHSVLTLDQYGLDWEDIWGPVDGTDIRYDLAEYGALLLSSLSQHKDPLHLIRRNVEPRFSLRLDGPGMGMFIADAENGGTTDRPPPDLVIKKVGDCLAFMITPRAEGHVLLLSNLHRTGATFIMNEHLEVPRTKVHTPYDPMWFNPAGATGEPGRRDIIAINWPKVIDPARYNLGEFFARTDYAVHDDELRRFGAAIAETASRPDAERVFAKMMPLALEP